VGNGFRNLVDSRVIAEKPQRKNTLVDTRVSPLNKTNSHQESYPQLVHNLPNPVDNFVDNYSSSITT
jgi:hypothetical protein